MSAILIALAAALGSATLTALVIRYARLSSMHDAPGARRMHLRPTVRGAGLGFALTILAGWAAFGWSLGIEQPLGRWGLATALALAVVAPVSWLDDHAGLPVWPRLLAHGLGALLIALAGASYLPWMVAAAALLVLVACTNFWNFIDGINGMAASQSLVLAIGVALVAWWLGDYPLAWFAALMAGALAAFLPFNFPHARAFMGDVGSASLGLVCGALLLAPLEDGSAWWVVLPLASAVLLDTGLTLLWRMSRRPLRRWYTGHREHLYQWLARSGWGHTRTTLAYLGWALGPGLAVVWTGLARPELRLIATVLLYLAGALIWRLGRDYALARRRA
ncbi:MAG: glycosyl transferase family 4 [Lysobacterales bacterium]